jgi:hypothetical protein
VAAAVSEAAARVWVASDAERERERAWGSWVLDGSVSQSYTLHTGRWAIPSLDPCVGVS